MKKVLNNLLQNPRIDNLVIFLKHILKKNITLILLFTLFLLVIFSPELMPFSPHTTIKGFSDFFVLVASVLAGILGLFIAVVILSFELRQKFHPDYAVRHFFENHNLRELFVLYLGTIFICGYAVLYEGHLNEIQSVNISWLVAVLFLVSLILLLDYIKKIIVTSSPNDMLKKLISSIDYWQIYPDDHVPPRFRTQIRPFGDNVFRVLAEAAQYSIKEGRGYFAQFILAETTERLVLALKDTTDKRKAMKNFLVLYKKISESAIQHSDFATTSLIPDCFERIHHLLAEEETKWSDFSELDTAFLEIFSQYAENNLEEQTISAFNALTRIFGYHLEFNCPPEGKIWSLDIENKKIKHDTDIELQWDHVQSTYSDMIISIISGFEEGEVSRNIASAGITRLGWLIDTVIRLRNLGIKQKKHIVGWLMYNASDNYLRLVKTNPKVIPGGLPLRSHTVKELYSRHKDEGFLGEYYENLGSLIFKLIKLKALNIFHLNDIAALARGNMRKVGTSALVDKSILFVIGLFEMIADYCIVRVHQSYFKRAYTECHYLLKNLADFGKDSPQKSAFVTRRLNKFLRKTESATRYKKDLEKDVVSWKKIVGS